VKLMHYIRTTARFFAFLERFLVAGENIGLIDAIKLFFLYRFFPPSENTSIFIQKLKRRFFFRGNSDAGIISHLYTSGYRICDRGTDQIKFIIDAGANIGVETLRFRFFHPTAKIIAIEPAEDNFRLLQQNCHGDEGIALVNKGLWSEACQLRVIAGSNNESFRVIRVSEDSDGNVLATSIEELMSAFNIPEIDILKLDVEGAEYQIFSEHVENWIDKVKVFIFECPDNDHKGAAFRIFKSLENLSYNCFIHGENLVLIRNDVPWELESNLFFEW